MSPYINTAIKTLRSASTILSRVSRDVCVRSDTKGSGSPSVVLEHTFSTIVHLLKTAYPKHKILDKEQVLDEYEYGWHVHCVSGQRIFYCGFPHYAIGLTLCKGASTHSTIIYDPLRNDLLSASKGQGAIMNNKRIRVNPKPGNLPIALYLNNPSNTYSFNLLNKESIRSSGCALLDAIHVASGYFDGMIAEKLTIPELLSCALIIKESGGVVTNFLGTEDLFSAQQLLAGPPKFITPAINYLQQAQKTTV